MNTWLLLFSLCWSVWAANSVLWTYVDPENEFSDCKFGGEGYIITLSSTLENQIQVFPTQAPPKPLWSVAGPFIELTSPFGNNSFVTLAGPDHLSLNFWNYSTSKPVGSDPLHGKFPADLNPIIVSGSGNLLVSTINTGAGVCNLNWWDQHGTPGNGWRGDEGFPARNAYVSFDGHLVLLDLSGRIVVLETDGSDLPVFDQPFNPHGTLCASQSGSFAYGDKHGGFTVFTYKDGKFNAGDDYRIHLDPDAQIFSCGLSDEYLIVTVLEKFQSQLVEIVFDMKQQEIAWQSKIPRFGPNNQPSQFTLTNDGKFFGVSNWGNLYQTAPQLNVYSVKQQNPIFQFQSPGSLYAVDLLSTRSGLYVVGCGKVVHKSIRKNGGYIVLAKLN